MDGSDGPCMSGFCFRCVQSSSWWAIGFNFGACRFLRWSPAIVPLDLLEQYQVFVLVFVGWVWMRSRVIINEALENSDIRVKTLVARDSGTKPVVHRLGASTTESSRKK
ncbi:hypothetical protein Rs2_49626 [Raphanus sativus]|nr:hypothetical protein Rs2_49626 [Raphanus sativus]